MNQKLIKELKSRSMSVNRLSFICKIASSDLYSALSGKKPLYPGWKKRIADALEMSVEELFTEEEERGQA